MPRARSGSSSAKKSAPSPIRRDKRALIPAAMIRACRAGDLAAVRKHLEAGHSVNGRDSPGYRPLATAAMNGRLPLVKMLLDAGADVDLQPAGGMVPRTPVALAAEYGHLPVVKELVARGARLNGDYDEPDRCDALNGAVARAHVPIVRFLLDHGASPWHQALTNAIRMDRDDLVAMLMDAGAKPDPIHVSLAARRDNTKILDRLVAAGVPFDAPAGGLFDETPLHEACVHARSAPCALRLIALGADVHARTRLGLTPLHLAAQTGVPEVVQALLTAGADPKARDKGGATPQQLARRMPAVLAAIEGMGCTKAAAKTPPAPGKRPALTKKRSRPTA